MSWAGWRDSPLCGFDVETDGTDPESAHIVTATVGIAQGSEWQPTSWLLKTDRPIPDEAQRVHGISTEQANRDGRDRAEVVAEIAGMISAAWLAGAAVVAYNAAFDLTVLDRELRRLNLGSLRLGGMVIDPLIVDKATDRYRKGSRKLADVCAHYGITLDNAHDAGADALAAARLAWMLAPRLPTRTDDRLASINIGMTQQRDWSREQRLGLADHFRTKDDEQVAREIESHLEWPILPVQETLTEKELVA